jgi:hypothetical protein
MTQQSDPLTKCLPTVSICCRVPGVWVLSFVICFPPLVGWKDKREDPPNSNRFSSRALTPATSALQVRPCETTDHNVDWNIWREVNVIQILPELLVFTYWQQTWLLNLYVSFVTLEAFIFKCCISFLSGFFSSLNGIPHGLGSILRVLLFSVWFVYQVQGNENTCSC